MPLLELTIRRIALIDELTIEWRSGLSALTGETGAGKSIIIGSIAFLMGERSDRDMLQSGAAKGGVYAVFDVGDVPAVLDTLRERGLDIDDGMLTLSRELYANGRTVCRAAGEALPLAAYRSITSQLVDLHGQHAHQSLLNAKSHLGFLDAFGDAAHAASLASVKDAWRSWRHDMRQLNALRTDTQERARRLDMLRFQLGELKEAKLTADEETRLEAQSRHARHAEKISSALRKAGGLVSGTERSSGALNALRQAAALLGGIADLDARYAALAERLESAGYELEDAASELSAALDESDIDPREIDRVESRLALIQRLGRKYGATTREMLSYQASLEAELAETLGGDERREELAEFCAKKEAAYREAADTLSKSRRSLADVFARRVLDQLADLSMEKARFAAAFAPDGEAREDGCDIVSFMISANPGEPLKPLDEVASGGELSRVMLALKTIAADRLGISVLVFDEIDTGISGRTAQAVSEKMSDIARSAQVICVTHLPQIAAMADNAYRVRKETDGEHTRTILEYLKPCDREEELARMLGGAEPNGGGTSQAYARTLIAAAIARKREMI